MNGWSSVAVGFAADEAGNGVAYARVGDAPTLRVPFSVKRYPALLNREIGYAALTAIAGALRSRGLERINLTVDDARLAADLREHREVPAPLILGYVRLRCALNQFREYRIADPLPDESDLTARARGDVAIHVAA